MNCRLCGEDTSLLIDLGMQPLANKYPSVPIDIVKPEKWQMNVMICDNCKCAQLHQLIDRDLMFEDYFYLSSINKELVQHFDALADKLLGSEFVLDIGSNDGILLLPLNNLGVRCLGVDPSRNVGKIANDQGLETLIGFFDRKCADFIAENYGRPDCIVASSIFTHLEDPAAFIEDLALLSTDDTKIIIEIEYLGNLLRSLQFERFYFDRPYYYSIRSMEFIFEKSGFKLIDIEEIAPHGGSLRFVFQKNSSKIEHGPRVVEFRKREQELLRATVTDDFAKNVEIELKRFKENLISFKENGKKVCGFGCPARLATITNLGEIGVDLIDYIFEDSPLKVGKYSPGMGIPIINSTKMSEIEFDVLVVFAYEYINSIYEKTKGFGVPHYSPIPFTALKDF